MSMPQRYENVRYHIFSELRGPEIPFGERHQAREMGAIHLCKCGAGGRLIIFMQTYQNFGIGICPYGAIDA